MEYNRKEGLSVGTLLFEKWEEEKELEKSPDKKPPGSRTREKGQRYQDGQFPKGKSVSNALGMLSKLK